MITNKTGLAKPLIPLPPFPGTPKKPGCQERFTKDQVWAIWDAMAADAGRAQVMEWSGISAAMLSKMTGGFSHFKWRLEWVKARRNK